MRNKIDNPLPEIPQAPLASPVPLAESHPSNANPRWWSLAQMLVWIVLRIEMLPRDAEQSANSPEMNPGIEPAWNQLKKEFWKSVLGTAEGVPIDKFRIPCGGRYADLRTLFQVPSGEPGAQSTAIDLFERDVRWQDVEYNSVWGKRAFPAPAAAVAAAPTVSAPVPPPVSAADEGTTPAPVPVAAARAAQESTPAQNVETTSSASAASLPAAPQTEPVTADPPLTEPVTADPAPVANMKAPVAEPEVASPQSPVDTTTTEQQQQQQQIPRLSSRKQSQWLKTALADNPPRKDEPLTPEEYGKRIADMGLLIGAVYAPSSVIARYYQLNPDAPRRRKPQK